MLAPSKPSQPCLMFLGQAVAYPSEGISLNPLTRLEIPAKDKHSSLLQVLQNCVRKKFHKFVPWGQCHKTFLVCNLQIIVIS